MSSGDAGSRLLAGELPTAAELLGIIEAEGYRVAVKDGRSVLTQVVRGGDREIVAAVAGVLKREPFRSQAMKLAKPDAEFPHPKPPPPPPLTMAEPERRPGEPEAEPCPVCGSWVWRIDRHGTPEVICGGNGCPYRKVTRGDPQAESRAGWKW